MTQEKLGPSMTVSHFDDGTHVLFYRASPVAAIIGKTGRVIRIVEQISPLVSLRIENWLDGAKPEIVEEDEIMDIAREAR